MSSGPAPTPAGCSRSGNLIGSADDRGMVVITPAMLARTVRALSEGRTVVQVASALGVKESALRSALRNRRPPAPGGTSAPGRRGSVLADLVRLVQSEGSTVDDAAQALRISPAYARTVLVSAGLLPPLASRRSQITGEALVDLTRLVAEDGRSVKDAAGALDLNYRSALDTCRERGIRRAGGVRAGAANQTRTSVAAVVVVESLQRILADASTATLSADEERIARLRVAHPEASLVELGALHDPPLSKDVYAARLRRLLVKHGERAAPWRRR